MDVRCERCSTVYDFAESRIPVEGLAVKCSTCAHVFRVFRNAPQHAEAEGQWMVRQVSGNVVQFKEMTTLQRWIVERKVGRDDEISKHGKSWKRLGEITELIPFFQVVERPIAPPTPLVPAPGGAARWEGAGPQSFASVPDSGVWQMGTNIAAPPAQAYNPAFAADYTDPQARTPTGAGPTPAPPAKGRGAVKWLMVLLLVMLAGAAGTVYVLKPDLVRGLFAPKVNEVALRQAQAGVAELRKDSLLSLDKARGMLEKAVALDGEYADARAELAQAQLNRAEYLAEQLAEDQKNLALLVEADRSAAQAAIDKGKGELKELTDKAFTSASQAYKVAPTSVAALRAMADYYRIMGAPERMKPLIDRARQAKPNDPDVAYVLGASVAGDPALAERAIRYFDEALEAAPDLVRARYKLARVFQAQGNAQKALLHVATILAAVPDHERAKALQGELEPPPVIEPAPPPPPETPAEPTPAKAPDKPLSTAQLFARAERLRDQDKPQQALALYEKAVAQEPGDPDGHTGLGWCYVDLEKPEAAIASFKRALQLVPRFTDAHLGIAEAFRMKGMKRDALKHYREYLDILPNGPEAAVAKRAIQDLQ